jgi:hypothetical protein
MVVVIRSLGDTALTALWWTYLATYGLMRLLKGEQGRRWGGRVLHPAVGVGIGVLLIGYAIAWFGYGATPDLVAQAVSPRCTSV